ncbi:unnamed protein product [Nezara viridula]|uniref:Uncharacterized protein n=1 Tax=Nezara viridula TaxID=85310 RepID=A0A9P0E6L1_NEZVI|nr:unnamed protein product [Nezara viridula]
MNLHISLDQNGGVLHLYPCTIASAYDIDEQDIGWKDRTGEDGREEEPSLDRRRSPTQYNTNSTPFRLTARSIPVFGPLQDLLGSLLDVAIVEEASNYRT